MPRATATILGVFAILFWSTTVAFSRSLTEQLGVFTAGGLVHFVAGAIGTAYVLSKASERRKLARIPWWYWVGCGGSFMVNIIFFYVAIGFLSSRQHIIEVGLINYLWISFTLLLSVPLLHKRPRIGLLPGIVIACSGIVVGAMQSGPLSWHEFRASIAEDAVPYALVFTGAIAWAVYSNLSRRWAAEAQGWTIPILLTATGLLLFAIRLCVTETTRWTPQGFAQLAFMITFPTLLAYVFWDTAMRRGTIVFVVSFSYLTPLLSTLISCAYLRTLPHASLLLACALVIGGAVLCRYSVVD